MPNLPRRLPFSPVKIMGGITGLLGITYIALIAVVMTYAALTVEFSQNVRNDEAAVAQLEAQYLANVASVTAADYQDLGYAKPSSIAYVPAAKTTALR